MDVLPELGTFPKWSRKTQMGHSSFLQTANEIKSFIGFCFPSGRSWIAIILRFFFILLEGEEKAISYSSITNSDMKMFIYFCCRDWVRDPTCIAISGKAAIDFSENWVVLLLGTGDAVISLICDSEKSVQSQGIEKQPTKMWKNILQKYPAIISVGLVIILGEVNNASVFWKHAVISKKYQIVGKFFPEGSRLPFENNYFKTNVANILKLTFPKHKMRGVWIWYGIV